jgi:hypothetical protein
MPRLPISLDNPWLNILTAPFVADTAPQGLHAPMGQLVSARQYPTAAFRDVMAPNADTLYSSAFLDV